MMILCDFGIRGSLGPILRAQTWALEHLIFLNCASGDLRWAIVALVSRSLTAAWGSLVRSVAGRAWQGARFAADLTAADTMVAAAGR
jgi:hypothetical protein